MGNYRVDQLNEKLSTKHVFERKVLREVKNTKITKKNIGFSSQSIFIISSNLSLRKTQAIKRIYYLTFMSKLLQLLNSKL